MSQLKEFNGLYYKECDILMLQSTHESNLNGDDIKKLIIKLKSLPNEKQLEITDTVESFDKWIEENL